ncbi:MAG: bi-domain-containing oxidoreductase [Chlorobiota bacterium]
MLQVLQHQRTGEIQVAEVPPPECVPEGVLVRTAFSLISSGTERTSVQTARASLLRKAWERPDLVRQVLRSIQREGLSATLEKVKARLEAYRPLGYSVAGVVVESRVPEFVPGDRVACAGAGYAVHAEYVTVPRRLVVPVPEGVPLEAAAYVAVGAIALNGVRQAAVQLGERVLVIGLGLLGLLTVQLLRAAGCRVVGMDRDPATFPTALAVGCERAFLSGWESVADVERWSSGIGVDAVIITAGTSSNEPLELGIATLRKRGRLVIVGAVGMDVPRQPFYEKELELRIATSYGPGRYDPFYEEQGNDYPIAYVRWTEQRNMEAFLQLLKSGQVSTEPLTTHRFPIHRATEAYELLTNPGQERVIGILLEYPQAAQEERAPEVVLRPPRSSADRPRIGVIGAGSFAQAHLLPALREAGVEFVAVATATPASARAVGERFGFSVVTTSGTQVIARPEVEAIVCATRHDTHADYVVEALRAGKPIFVEKPLAITLEQLRLVEQTLAEHGGAIMVGFNRRFSAPLRDIKAFFADRVEPLSVLYRVNAGALPATHWLRDPRQGGRILGEACHFVDCMVFLTDSLPDAVAASAVRLPAPDAGECVSAILRFRDGSVGVLQYLTTGPSAVGKEFCEVFCQGRVARMEDFRSVEFFDGRRRKLRQYDGSKGHREEMRQFVEALRTKAPFPIPYEQLRAVTLATFAIQEALRSGAWVAVDSLLSSVQP